MTNCAERSGTKVILETSNLLRENMAVNQGKYWSHRRQEDWIFRLQAEHLKRHTKKDKFLAEMDKVVPWQTLQDLSEPGYPKAGGKGGRLPYALATMLRIHVMHSGTASVIGIWKMRR